MVDVTRFRTAAVHLAQIVHNGVVHVCAHGPACNTPARACAYRFVPPNDMRYRPGSGRPKLRMCRKCLRHELAREYLRSEGVIVVGMGAVNLDTGEEKISHWKLVGEPW
jgi:hypothetical protein